MEEEEEDEEKEDEEEGDEFPYNITEQQNKSTELRTCGHTILYKCEDPSKN